MHHNDLYNSVKLQVWEKSIFQVYTKMLLANQIPGFLNFNISKTIRGIRLIFCMQVHVY